MFTCHFWSIWYDWQASCLNQWNLKFVVGLERSHHEFLRKVWGTKSTVYTPKSSKNAITTIFLNFGLSEKKYLKIGEKSRARQNHCGSTEVKSKRCHRQNFSQIERKMQNSWLIDWENEGNFLFLKKTFGALKLINTEQGQKKKIII